MSRLHADIQLSDIGSLCWPKEEQHTPCRILKMSVNRASMIFSFASWVIYVLIGCRHPFIRYWQFLLAQTTVTCSLPYSENERQWSFNDFKLCIFDDLCSNWLQTSTYQILAAFTGINNSDMLPATS